MSKTGDRLVVVSNRVTPSAEGKAQGGLAVAMHAALRESGGLWFGWSGQTGPNPNRDPKVQKIGRVTFATVDLPEDDFEDFYNGFANATLWPLFHYRPNLAQFNRRTAQAYQRVNAEFAGKLAPLLRDDDLVWIHDYQLIPMGEQLRQMGCRQRLGFFLHIPFPVPELLSALPNHEQLVRSLCAYDVVGFQTTGDRDAFLSYLLRFCDAELVHEKLVEVFGRRVWVDDFPISIETADLEWQAAGSFDTRPAQRLRESIRGRDLLLGVDRLDYSKGLPQRFKAVGSLLEDYPGNRGRIVFMQIAPPSRTGVREYQEIRAELEGLAGGINGAYSDFDWSPVRYLNKSFTRRTLLGFLRSARIGLVTPLRDGMNLVAKEYVAAQNPDDPGVLVLSHFAGAAKELSGGAVMVNPYDVEGVAEAIQRGLAMPLEERRERHAAMLEVLRHNTIDHWRERFLDQLRAAPFHERSDNPRLGRPPARLRVS